MTVNINDIKVDACFKTSTDQHRRILTINDAQTRLIYESWSGKIGVLKGQLSQIEVSIDKFIEDVDSVITCDINLTPLKDVTCKSFKSEL